MAFHGKPIDYNYCFYLPEPVTRFILSSGSTDEQAACLVALYSMDAQGRLDEYREHLPRYLLRGWEACAALLVELAQAGMISVYRDGVNLVHGQSEYRGGKGALDYLAEMAGMSREQFLAETDAEARGQ